MLLEPVDPELDPSHGLDLIAKTLPKRHGLKDRAQVFNRPASLDILDQSLRLSIWTCPNFVEHYHMAHMCLVVALSRKLTSLQGTRGEDFGILRATYKGWNLKLRTRETDAIGACEHPIVAWDALPSKSTCFGEIQGGCSDSPTVDRLSEVEDELIRRIADLKAENLAAAEEIYECIRNLYEECLTTFSSVDHIGVRRDIIEPSIDSTSPHLRRLRYLHISTSMASSPACSHSE